MLLQETIDRIQPISRGFYARAQSAIDGLTKPVGSLGRLEDLAARYVAMTQVFPPKIPQAMVFTLAADHGVAGEGVSAYPSSVTAQMVQNFLKGGAAVNVLARQVGSAVRVVDMGVQSDLAHLPGLIIRKIGMGTKNFLRGPAMSREEAVYSIETGIRLIHDVRAEGIGRAWRNGYREYDRKQCHNGGYDWQACGGSHRLWNRPGCSNPDEENARDRTSDHPAWS